MQYKDERLIKKIMHSVNAISFTSNASDWLACSHHPRVLHVFDRACNLINEHREVLSIVTPQVGNGPFNLVVQDDVCFSEHLSCESNVSISPTQLHLRDLTIYTRNTNIWSPHPNWESLHEKRDTIANQLMKLAVTQRQVLGLDTGFIVTQPYSTTVINQKLPITNYRLSNSLVYSLSSALAISDISNAKEIASKLAGLGPGLTPAGDDILIGATYAVWIIHPPNVASVLAQAIANAAAPLTTSLSAAWLRSAGRGETGILWHQLFDAALAADEEVIHQTVNNILSVGETSGADALVGFMSTLACISRPPNL